MNPLPTLTVLCGLPAAGKSTWARRFGGGTTVLSADGIRELKAPPAGTIEALVRAARAALSRREDVTIDACSIVKRHREAWLALAQEVGAKTLLILIDCPVEIAIARDAQRPSHQQCGAYFISRYATFWAKERETLAGESWSEVRTFGNNGEPLVSPTTARTA